MILRFDFTVFGKSLRSNLGAFLKEHQERLHPPDRFALLHIAKNHRLFALLDFPFDGMTPHRFQLRNVGLPFKEIVEAAPSDMVNALPGVRLRPDPKRGLKRKLCVYLCASECWVTPDPVCSERKSIRWYQDVAESTESAGKGTSDWYCDRTWVNHSNATGDKDKDAYIEALSKDRDKLNDHLARRTAVIERCKGRVSTGKKQGG